MNFAGLWGRLRVWVWTLAALAAMEKMAALPPPEGQPAGLDGVPFPSTFVDRNTWLEILRQAQDGPARENGGREALGEVPGVASAQPAGGVVPHHLLAGSMMAGFFREMRAARPERVVVLGPNHRGLGAPVITADRDWDTPAGAVRVDAGAVRVLTAAGAVLDDQAMQAEHAMGNLMPFLGHYLPGARVVPVVLRGGMSLARLQRLAGDLEPLLDGQTLVVASVDFSHYLSATEARLKDRQTLAAMQRSDLAAILTMGNDHLDSPPALALLFLLMERRGRMAFTVTGHANSGEIMQNENIATTSYFTLRF